MAAEKRGSIAFFTTSRPTEPVDIFSSPLSPTSNQDELHMTDGVSHNYNGQIIPQTALKTILKRPLLASEANEADVDSGRLSGMVFVSERAGNLETLHIALQFNDNPPKVKVFSVSDVFSTFNGVRMEDSGCISGDYLVYVTTKDPATNPRQPWTAVYKTSLITGETSRLTPPGQADLSPSVSPSGKKITLASFEGKVGGWNGENEDLQTDIFVMNVEEPFERRLVVRNGGWPTWGSDNVIFFHRKVGEFWGVFRADISNNGVTSDTLRVTPDGIDALTPAAIDATTVAVAAIRKKSMASEVQIVEQYRHIEVFDSTGHQQTMQITRTTSPMVDHFNPFVIDGGKRIGYHRCKSDLFKDEDIERQFHTLDSSDPDIGLFRLPGGFSTFSKDGSKLAFVDNEFKVVWVADSEGLHNVFEKSINSIFSLVWNQDPQKDTLYVCMRSFKNDEAVDICAVPAVSNRAQHRRKLTKGFNNSFPSTNPEGTKLVFQSTRHGYKNLYIMEDVEEGEFGEGTITRLTSGPWVDTQCQWSPSGDWIVFSSTRNNPQDALESDNNLDLGYFAVFLVNVNDSSVVARVTGSGNDFIGNINHPFFSPDGNSIVVTSDLAAVSVDPISLHLSFHSVMPCGDIFTFDIDPVDITKNKNVKKFKRITHSRYENFTGAWTMFSTQDPNATWNLLLNKPN